VKEFFTGTNYLSLQWIISLCASFKIKIEGGDRRGERRRVRDRYALV